MEGSSSIVPVSESKGKEIVTQQQNISLADLKPTDTDKAIYVRAYRKWTPTNKQGKPAMFCCILIDAQGGAIQATANIREKPKFNALLQTNRTYRITGFGFQNAKTYMQVVPHSLSLAFGTYTDIKEIPDVDFPSHYFNFTQYRDLFPKIDVKEGMLTDYIGCVQYVSDIQHPVKRTPDSPIWIDIGIQNLDGRIVRFTLWNEDAHTFRKEEYEKAERPVIIAVSSCLVKHYGGLQLSATNATHYYFNPKIPECTEIRSVYEQFVDPPAITNVQYQRFADPQQEKQRNRVKLADLISENPENQQNVRFTVIATITSIEKNRPWFFRKCHDCKLKISERFPHTHCKQPATETDFIYSYCFRVQLSDETGQITMTCFSNEANSMVKDCKQLLQSMTDQNPYEYPPEVIGLEGTTKNFQLHFDPESTKAKQIFILDTCWDNLPLITAPVPALTETSANSPKQTASPDQLSIPEETKPPTPITHTKPEPPSPQTSTVVAETGPRAKKEETATTPVSDQPAVAQASKPANQPAKKTARKPLFQGNPDTSAGANAKKSKKED